MPRGTIKATVLIETILAAFEMDEILYELREHSAGLNAGRWDYIFSVIKKLGHRPEFVLPDRGDVTMAVPFMRVVLRAARADVPPPRRLRDGRHGGVHPVAARPGGERGRAGEGARGQGARGVAGLRRDVGRAPRPRAGRARGLRRGARRRGRTRSTGGATTCASGRPSCSTSRPRPARSPRTGLRSNIAVGIQYLGAWLQGSGAVAINNLMEDAATAEISRSQVWQWLRHDRVSPERVRALDRRGGRPPRPGLRGRARAVRARRHEPGLRRVPDAAGVRPPPRLKPAPRACTFVHFAQLVCARKCTNLHVSA